MKKIKTISFCIALSLMAALTACKDNADENAPRGSSIAPEQVTVREVKNYKGRSVVYYNLPDDLNLRYVRGVFTPRGNAPSDVIASFYSDSLVFEGFAKAGPHEVKLYSVSSGEAASKPVTVTIEPLTPPYQDVLNNMEVLPSFSGMYIRYENEMENELAIVITKKNSQTGEWSDVHTQYTGLKTGEYAVRGQASVPTDFAVRVRDRWGNISTPREENFTPWFEEEVPKPFSLHNLPGDSWECHTWGGAGHVSATNSLDDIWDGLVNDAPAYQAKTTVSLPNWITFDINRSYQISRFVMHTRVGTGTNPANVFKAGHVRNFELWGCNETPPVDGSFTGGWFKVSDYESFRPSGATVAVNATFPFTPEDLAVGMNGEEFLIPEGTPPFRYVRIVTTRTWGGVVYPHISEVFFYGGATDSEPAK